MAAISKSTLSVIVTQQHTVGSNEGTCFSSNIIFNKKKLLPSHEIKISFNVQHKGNNEREIRCYKFIRGLYP